MTEDLPITTADDKRVSSRQKVYIGITKAGSDMFSVLFAVGLLGFYVYVLHMDPTNYGTVLIVFAVFAIK